MLGVECLTAREGGGVDNWVVKEWFCVGDKGFGWWGGGDEMYPVDAWRNEIFYFGMFFLSLWENILD
jgi:hypothetical protein